MTKNRGIKILIWIVMSVLLASSVFMASFAIYNKRKEKKEPSAAFIFNSSSSRPDASTYNSTSEFHISNREGLLAFSAFNMDGQNMNDQSGNIFAGKTVKLTADIEVGTIDDVLIAYFQGVFDGQGHVLGGIKCTNESTLQAAFCHKLNSGGVIKNLELRSVSIKVPTGNVFDTSFGAVVYWNFGTVENCIVNGFYFKSDRFKSNCRTAPLCGVNEGTIKNSIVRGTYEIAGNDDNGLLNDDGLYAHYFVVSGNEASHCVFGASMRKSGVTGELNEPSTHDSALSSGNDNHGSFDAGYKGLSSSVASETTGSSGSAWYKYKKTSSGSYQGFGGSASYPVYLRVFISWTTYTFSASPSGAGTVNIGTITVPSDYKTVGTSGNNKTCYGNTIIPTPSGNNDFDKWTNSGNAYTANFIVRITLTFATASNTTIDSSSTAKTGTTYVLTKSSTITFTQESFSKTGCYKTYTISFTDKNGTSYFIKYVANSSYYISSNTLSTSNSSCTITNNKSGIKVNTGLKVYGMVIK